MSIACFKFYGSLNDFLLQRNRNTRIEYSFHHNPSIKDAIEAIGVPHVEVKDVVVNGHITSMDQRLEDGTNVEIHPFPYQQVSSPRFILDVHLGKLARLLRLMGFDTLYNNEFEDKTIVAIAKEQHRIVLTRDVGLLKHKAVQYGYWLRSQQPMQQAIEIIQRFQLHPLPQPFKRCIACNGLIEPVSREAVEEDLLPNTRKHFTEFFQCRDCKRIYWKGSHYERMLRLWENLSK